MKNKLHSSTWMSTVLTLCLMLALATGAMAAVTKALVFQPSAGSAYQAYMASTKTQITLTGTEKMKYAIQGSVDTNGLDDDLVYNNTNGKGLFYYRIPADGKWNATFNHRIPNTPKDAVPLTVINTGGSGTTGKIIYKDGRGRAYAINPNGTGKVYLGYIDKAFAGDLRGLGYKGDLIYWTSGVGLKWREGISGTIRSAPGADWVPVGVGMAIPSQPGKIIGFHTTNDITPSIYMADKDWRITKLHGTTWPWSMNNGSMLFGDIDGDQINEIVYDKSATDPLQWYNVPDSTSTGIAWNASGVVTESIIKVGWNLRGIGSVDLVTQSAVTNVSNIIDLKNLSNGTVIQLSAKPRTKLVRELDSSLKPVVTGYYIEEQNQSAGIRVVGTTAATEGQFVSVKGTLSTQGGERVIVAISEILSSTKSIVAPVQSTIRTVVGTLGMAGLFVQLTGTISSPTTGGFKLVDAEQNVIDVQCADALTVSGSVTLKGCVGIKTTGSMLSSIIRVESASDVSSTVVTPPPPPPPPPPSTTPAKYTTWTKPSLEKIFKDSPSATLQPITIKAAGNEYESFQIVMRTSTTAVSSITLTASDLVSTSGSIPASNVSLYLPWYINLPALGKQYADPLPPYQSAFNMATNQTQPIWVEVYAPRNTPAGDYRGTITIRDASTAVTTVQYTLHVYNFSLPSDWKMATAMGMRWNNLADKHGVTRDSAAHIALKKKYYEMALQHGISIYDLPVSLMSTEANSYLADPRMTSYSIPFQSGGTVFSQSTLLSYINKVKSVPGAWQKSYFYVWDEPRTQSDLDTVRWRANYLHGLDSTAKIMLPFSTNNVNVNPTTYFDGYVDIFCPVTSWMTSSIVSGLNARRAEGAEIWSYYCWGVPRQTWAQMYLDCASTSYPMIFWQNYNANITGFLYWDVIFWEAVSDPWVDINTIKPDPAIYGEGVLFYPGKKVSIDGPVGSIRLKLVRDGLEDYQKMWMLEQKTGRSSVLPIVRQVTTDFTQWTRDANLLQSARDEMAQEIETN